MITEQDLQEAIAECIGKRNPDASTCIKLAAFYTIQNELYGKPAPQYSYAQAKENTSDKVAYDSGTEFSDAIFGKEYEAVFQIVDELMETLKVLQPPLYNAVIRKLTNL